MTRIQSALAEMQKLVAEKESARTARLSLHAEKMFMCIEHLSACLKAETAFPKQPTTSGELALLMADRLLREVGPKS